MTESTRAAGAASEPASSALSATWGSTAIKTVAALVLAAALLDWLYFLWRALHTPVGQYDFSSYYAAALAIRHNPHANIYAAQVLNAAGALAHVQVQPPLPYTYPPLMAILLSPFTILSFRVAARLWLLVNAGLCLLVVAALANEIALAAGVPAGARSLRAWLTEPVRLAALAIAAVIVLAAAPARQTMLTGQIDLLVLLPLALVPWLLRTRRDTWAGAAIAFAAMLKLTPGLLLLYFVLRGRWKAFWAAVATLVGLALLSMLVVGPSVFFAAIPQALQIGSGDAVLGQNEALVAPLAGAHVVLYAALAALALALGWLVWRPGHEAGAQPATEHASDDVLTYGIALCGMLLLFPTAWVHHYVWVLPALALASGALLARVNQGRGASGATLTLAAALLLAVVLVDLSLPYSLDTDQQPVVTALAGLPLHGVALETRAIGTVLAVAVLAVAALRVRQRTGAGPAST